MFFPPPPPSPSPPSSSRIPHLKCIHIPTKPMAVVPFFFSFAELNHPCLSSLVEVFNSETHVFMAIETLDGGSMRDELRRGGLVDEARARGLFQQVGRFPLRGCRCMYSRPRWVTIARPSRSRLRFVCFNALRGRQEQPVCVCICLYVACVACGCRSIVLTKGIHFQA